MTIFMPDVAPAARPEYLTALGHEVLIMFLMIIVGFRMLIER
jgi:hypothetical protein